MCACMFIWLYVHAYSYGSHVYTCMLTWVHVQICLHACRRQTSTLGDIAQELSVLCFEMGLFTDLGLTHLARLADQGAQKIHPSLLPQR